MCFLIGWRGHVFVFLVFIVCFDFVLSVLLYQKQMLYEMHLMHAPGACDAVSDQVRASDASAARIRCTRTCQMRLDACDAVSHASHARQHVAECRRGTVSMTMRHIVCIIV